MCHATLKTTGSMSSVHRRPRRDVGRAPSHAGHTQSPLAGRCTISSRGKCMGNDLSGVLRSQMSKDHEIRYFHSKVYADKLSQSSVPVGITRTCRNRTLYRGSDRNRRRSCCLSRKSLQQSRPRRGRSALYAPFMRTKAEFNERTKADDTDAARWLSPPVIARGRKMWTRARVGHSRAALSGSCHKCRTFETQLSIKPLRTSKRH